MRIDPKTELKLDLWVDADFAGLWNSEDANDSTCVKSRTGYVCTLGDVPIVWASKLQTEIALSTTEAEYIAASTAMRALLPLRRLVQEVIEPFGIERSKITNVSMVWEDNNAVLTMCSNEYPSMTPRSKHIAVKMHWFLDHLVSEEEAVAKGDGIVMKRVSTDQQKADIFTKGLKPIEFVKKRKFIMGW
jgi:hypothetical protein